MGRIGLNNSPFIISSRFLPFLRSNQLPAASPVGSFQCLRRETLFKPLAVSKFIISTLLAVCLLAVSVQAGPLPVLPPKKRPVIVRVLVVAWCFLVAGAIRHERRKA